jgi:hypothetical protein
MQDLGVTWPTAVLVLLLSVCAAELTVQWNNPTNENTGCIDFFR